ncbi:MAG: CoA-binding protein [Planctomycetota bacterium]
MAGYRVAVLGASPKEERYSNKAVKMLLGRGHTVFPLHPACPSIHGLACTARLEDLPKPIHTLTVYLNEANSTRLIPKIIDLHPQRIILNPGAENPHLEEKAIAAGITVLNACTLVLLTTNQF